MGPNHSVVHPTVNIPTTSLTVISYPHEQRPHRSSVIITPIDDDSQSNNRRMMGRGSSKQVWVEKSKNKGKMVEEAKDTKKSVPLIVAENTENQMKMEEVKKEVRYEGPSGTKEKPVVVEDDNQGNGSSTVAPKKVEHGVWKERLPRPVTRPAEKTAKEIEREIAARYYNYLITMQRKITEQKEELYDRGLTLIERDEKIASLQREINLVNKALAEAMKQLPTPPE